MDVFERISRKIFRPASTIVTVILFSLLTILPVLASPAWMIIDRISVKGDQFWDHATLQPEQHRLFVAHHNQLVVIDLLTRAEVGSISGQDICKAIIVPQLNRGFVTDADAGTTGSNGRPPAPPRCGTRRRRPRFGGGAAGGCVHLQISELDVGGGRCRRLAQEAPCHPRLLNS